MKKAAMEDGKLNKVFNAAGNGARRAASAAGNFSSRLFLWQKAGLILCLVFWIVSAIIGAVTVRITSNMPDQNFRSRWSPGGNCAQISTYLSDPVAASDDTVKELRSYFSNMLQTASIALTEKQIENGASLMDVCYCGIASADVSTPEDTVHVTMIGVGGDFFNFHPLELLDGYYFSEEELMKDRVLLDDQTAWRLFGSPNIVGLSVDIGGEPHYIAGVFHKPEGKFYNEAGMGDYLIFGSYDSLCRYTEKGAVDGGGDSDGDSDGGYTDSEASIRDEKPGRSFAGMTALTGGSGAFAGKNVPSAAAWRFVSGDAAVLYAMEDMDADDSGDSQDGGDDAGKVEEKTEPEELDDHMSDSDRDYPSGSSPSGNPDEDQKEVDRNRITVYEIILPNPVTGFAVSKVRSAMTEAGIPSDQMTIVDNSSRYDTYRLALLTAEPGLRSMQTAAIRYPYWENVALAWEDLLIPYAFIQLFLRFSPFLFLFYLVLWYATHKSWTLGGIIRNIQDRIYDRQSERIYGRHSAAAVETKAADSSDGALPEGGDEEPYQENRELSFSSADEEAGGAAAGEAAGEKPGQKDIEEDKEKAREKEGEKDGEKNIEEDIKTDIEEDGKN